jgi:four helix bundle protein
MAKSYRELEVWKRAIELSVVLYKLTRDFPREEIYGLTSQLRRAGVSVASNIAEGMAGLPRGSSGAS